MAKCIRCGRNLPAFTFTKKICSWCVQHEAAQRGELQDDGVQQVMPVPWAQNRGTSMLATQIIFGINAAVFVGMLLAGVSITDPTSSQLIHWGANSGPLTLGGEWWRLLTSVFLHIGIIHIALNMWCLWSLGSMAESLYGSVTFTGVYLVCGAGGSLASVLWRPMGLSAGASGAIFGITGALISSYYLGEFSAPRAAVGGSLRSVVTFAIYNLIFGAMSGRTDNACHIGGLVTGLLLGALIAKLAPSREAAVFRWFLIGAVALAVAGGTAWLQHRRGHEIHASRGNEFMEAGNYEDAIREYQAALRVRPSAVQTHIDLAQALYYKSRLVESEAELKRALALDQRNTEIYGGLGYVYLAAKRPREAYDAFHQVLSISRDDADAHFGQGRALADLGEHPAAIQEFKTSLQLDAEMTGSLYYMGISLTRLKNYDEAIRVLRQEQQAAGDSSDTELALAEAYRAKNMLKEAAAALAAAEKLKNQQ